MKYSLKRFLPGNLFNLPNSPRCLSRFFREGRQGDVININLCNHFQMKRKLLTFALAATFFNLLFISQFASGQNSRLWATYYGGTIGTQVYSAATDAVGNVYLAGTTQDTSGIASGGFQDTLPTGLYGALLSGAFLVKFDANGNRLWATYYGGRISSIGLSVATDALGNVYLAGTTQDTTGIASGGFQNTYGGNGTYGEGDAFLVKFDANGNRLWATYYGGEGDDNAYSVATDASGNVYLSGNTNSPNNIASAGFQDNLGSLGGWDCFLVKFDGYGNRLWATYYGGENDEFAGTIATDSSGNVFLSGTTASLTHIASGGFLDTLEGGFLAQAAFLVKFDSGGNRLWATYYGGSTNDVGWGTATDPAGNVYLSGNTVNDTGIASGGFQNTFGGGIDAFLVKFDSYGNRLWATYYGGANEDEGTSVATDALGNVFLGGHSESSSGIASGGFLDTYGGVDEEYVVKFDAAGNRFCATYYSPEPGEMEGGYIAVDPSGNVYLTAFTSVTSGIASGGFQNTFGGGTYNAYLVKFTSCAIDFQSSDSTFCSGECINYTDLTTTNATSWQWSFPGGTPSSSTIQNPQGICYYTPGTYNSRLIASNGGSSDTLTFSNFIKVHAAPPTPVITQHYDHDTLFCTTDSTYTSYQWYDSSTVIPGATDTFLVVTHNGNYNVGVTNKFGCKISVGITIVIGIQNYTIGNLFSLSPNPANQSIVISLLSAVNKKIEITIIDVLGQQVLSFPHLLWRGGGGEAIDISELPAGMYFLQMKTENGSDTKRFVKE